MAGNREPNGKLSRKVAEVSRRSYERLERAEVEALSVAVGAREVRYDLDKANSRDTLAGSYLGRLCLGGEMSRAQFDAGMTYLEDWQKMSAAISAPRAPNAVDFNAARGASNYENEDASIRAVATWRGVLRAIQSRQDELRGTGALNAALYHIVLMDHEFHHLVGSAREALNALVRHYRIGDKKAA